MEKTIPRVQELAARRKLRTLDIKNANQFGKAVGLNPATANRIWHGDFNLIKLRNLLKICQTLRATPDEVLGYAAIGPPQDYTAFTFNFKIEPLAVANGINNAHQLALKLHVSPSLAQQYWNGTNQTKITRLRLALLCTTFSTTPSVVLGFRPLKIE